MRTLTLIFAISLLTAANLSAEQRPSVAPHTNNTWFHESDSNTVIVFVHGIFSDSDECWKSSSGIYWPELLESDPRFENPAIFLGGYDTRLDTRAFDLKGAADELLSFLKPDSSKRGSRPLSKPRILFVAHSTGGIVVRYMIERYREYFVDKVVGVVLLASPSRGSAWANRLEWINAFFKNKLAGQLALNGDLIMDLDSRFSDLVYQKDKKLPGLVGKDMFESKFILRWGPFALLPWTYVVSPFDSSSYFGAFRSLPLDHFEMAKPNALKDLPHQYLWEFYDHEFRSATASETPRQPANQIRMLTSESRATYSTPNCRPDAKPDSGWWQSCKYAPQQASFSFINARTITRIVFTVQQDPFGETVHELSINGTKVKTFADATHHGQDLVFAPPEPIPNVTTITISTTKSPSWVSWGGVYIFGY